MSVVLYNEKVTCSGCKREYNFSPDDDYYNATNDDDGVCLKCFQTQKNAPLMGVAPSASMG